MNSTSLAVRLPELPSSQRERLFKEGALVTLTHFWGVGEEKPATFYEGEPHGKTATKFYQGITGSYGL